MYVFLPVRHPESPDPKSQHTAGKVSSFPYHFPFPLIHSIFSISSVTKPFSAKVLLLEVMFVSPITHAPYFQLITKLHQLFLRIFQSTFSFPDVRLQLWFRFATCPMYYCQFLDSFLQSCFTSMHFLFYYICIECMDLIYLNII